MPLCKQRKHCKHSFSSVGLLAWLAQKTNLLYLGALPLSKTKLNFQICGNKLLENDCNTVKQVSVLLIVKVNF